MKKPGSRVKQGMIVAIPLGDRFCFARVLYKSKVYADVILLGVFPECGASIGECPNVDRDEYVELLYTAGACVRSCWTILGQTPARERDDDFNIRTVGSEVWKGDECLRTASKEELRQLPAMEVAGCAAAVLWLQEAFRRKGR